LFHSTPLGKTLTDRKLEKGINPLHYVKLLMLYEYV